MEYYIAYIPHNLKQWIVFPWQIIKTLSKYFLYYCICIVLFKIEFRYYLLFKNDNYVINLNQKEKT